MNIERLRVVGFKSFADAAEVTIGPGLTGVIGPNGCGKSNLVEALRWVMGESSARRLRGGVMDEVIFAGSARRPARNLAEVGLTLDNHNRDAPFAFNDSESIEIERRIERGGGSNWRVNGREVRGRDVQWLFADAATGGASGSFVSQGRVGSLIEARPAERRFLLEEAAGTAGVQARRRETEQKLAAAEENLARLDNVVATLGTQLAGLKRQARQAQRYRRLGEQIRQQQALVFYVRWAAAAAEAETRAGELAAAERALAEAEQRAAAERGVRDEAETALPALRREETEAAAELQRLTQTRAALEQELARLVTARRETERRLDEVTHDRERAAAQLAEAEAALARLEGERAALAGAEAAMAETEIAAEARLRQTAAELAAVEAALQQATGAAAEAQAQRAAFERRHRDVAEACRRLEMRLAEAESQRAALVARAVPQAARTAAKSALAAAEARVAEAHAAIEALEQEAVSRQRHEAAASDAARCAAAALARLEAEAQALEAVVAPVPASGGGVPIMAALRVAAGFEAAVGALFEDELLAPPDPGADADCGWFALPALAPPDLPAGAQPFAAAVTAPPALARTLAFAGWVEDGIDGRALQPHLAPGQRLVDRAGRLWRWDGFSRLAAGGAGAAQQLRHRNRLETLAGEIAAARAANQAAAAGLAAAAGERRDAAEAERVARVQLREAEAALAQARAAETELAGRALATETRLEAVAETVAKLAPDLSAARREAEETARRLAALPQIEPAAAAIEAARAAAAEARRADTEARATIGRLRQEREFRRERLGAIEREASAWRRRCEDALKHSAILEERRQALAQEHALIAARPAAIADESEPLAAAIAAAARHAREAAERLNIGETRLRAAAERSGLADRALADAREHRARAEVQAAAAAAARQALARDIGERMATEPAALAEIAGIADGRPAPDAAPALERLDRLTRERDGIGPVNLTAEDEAAALAAEVERFERERADLTSAIAKLRRGAHALDQQGRELLVAALDRVNRHFGELFTRLFGGGKAELALTDDGDPLTAGLEIMASPSGKRLQSLSLLSGGEQALTALALLFAVFLTNPAPICVLDEVDAPLDDANVDRLCGLVAEIAGTTGTRFLLITHHRITMARADRLFGVTMAEPGVSQLVSVDLAGAVRLRQSA